MVKFDSVVHTHVEEAHGFLRTHESSSQLALNFRVEDRSLDRSLVLLLARVVRHKHVHAVVVNYLALFL